jgi:hypothetical protein
VDLGSRRAAGDVVTGAVCFGCGEDCDRSRPIDGDYHCSCCALRLQLFAASLLSDQISAAQAELAADYVRIEERFDWTEGVAA